jgi:uncharacterized protein (TIGR03067 family)
VTRALALLIVLAVPAFAAPVPKGVKKKEVTLEGDWRLDTEERDGKVGQRTGSHNLWRVTDGQMTLIAENNPQGQKKEYPTALVTAAVDGTSLRTFDYTVLENKYQRNGVCAVDGDTLKIAFGKEPKTRPDKLTSEGGGYLYTFKRVQPDR